MTALPSEPKLHGFDNPHSISIERLLSLLPVTVWATILFGTPALLRMVLSALLLPLLDAAGRYVQGRFLGKPFAAPFSLRGAVVGLLIPLTMPSDLPIWLLILADLIAALLLQALRSEANLPLSLPALLGCLLLLFPAAREYPLILDSEDGVTLLSLLRAGEMPNLSVADMFFGRMDGNIGEVCSILLLLSGGYLLCRRMIGWQIPLAGLIGAAFTAYVTAPDTMSVYYYVGAHLLSGGFLLVLIYFAADPASAPLSSKGGLCYGALFGVLTILIRNQFELDGALPAMLIVSLLARPLDRYLSPLPFGGRRK